MRHLINSRFQQAFIWGILGFLTLLCACRPSPDTLLLRQEGNWELKREVYEEFLDLDLIGGRDSLNQGSLSFFVTENGSWVLPDSSLIDFTWVYDKEEELMSLAFDEIIFADKQAFDFKVVENSARKQIWESVSIEYIWNPLQQDTSERRILARWQLERE